MVRFVVRLLDRSSFGQCCRPLRARPARGRVAWLALLLFSMLGAGRGEAATKKWDGGAGNTSWGSGNNWSANGVPGSGDDIVFDNTLVGTIPSLTLGGDRSVRSLTFTLDDTFSIGNDGGNLRSLDLYNAAGITRSASSSGTQTLDFSYLDLRANVTFSIGGTGAFVINSKIRNNDSTARAITRSGAGTLDLRGDNTFSGGLRLNDGLTLLGHDNAAGTGTLTFAGGSLGATNGARTIANTVTATGAATVIELGGTQNLTFTGTFGLGTGDRTVEVTNSATTTISGNITGSGNLTKTGAGLLVLNGSAGHTGSTTVGAGTLQLGANDRLSDSARLTVDSGATFDLNGKNETVGSLAGAGTVAMKWGQLTAGGDGTSTTFSGTFTDGGAFTKAGTGTLILSGNSSGWAGSFAVSAGTLQVEHANALGGVGWGNTVASGATLAFNHATGMAISEGGTTISGDGAGGNGALRNVAGANSFSGDLTLAGATRIQVDAGSLTLTGAIQGASQALTIAGAGAFSTTGALNSGGSLTLQGAGNRSFAQQVNLQANTLNVQSTGVNTFGSDVTANGGVTLGAGTTSIAGQLQAAGGLTITGGTNSITGQTQANSGITLSGGSTTFGGLVSTGGTLALTTSGTTVFGGNVSATTAINLSAGNTTFNGTVASTGALTVSGSAAAAFAQNVTTNGITLGSTGAVSFGSGTVNTGTGSITVNTNNNVSFGGLVDTTALVLNGTGTTTLSGTATNQIDATTVNAGTLVLAKSAGTDALSGSLTIGDGSGVDTVRLGASNQIKDDAAVTLASSGVLDLNGFNETLKSLTLTGNTISTGAGTLTLTDSAPITTNASATSATISGNLTVTQYSNTISVANGTAANDLVISAAISGDDATNRIIKTGAGTLVLSGANTFKDSSEAWDTGLDIQGGTVVVSGSGTLGHADNNVGLATGTTLRIERDSLATGSGSELKVNGAATVEVTNGNTFTHGGGLQGSSTLTKTGAGNLAIAGASGASFSGNINVTAGTLTAAHATALGTGGTTTVSSGATLAVQGGINVATESSLSLTGTGASGGGALRSVSGDNTWTGAIALAGASSIQVDAGSLSIGAFTGSTGLSKTGAGNLILTGSTGAGYTGNIAVTSGTLTVANGTALGTGGTTSVSGTGTLALQGGITVGTETMLNLAGTGQAGGGALRNVSGTNRWDGNVTLTADATITSAAGLLKLGDDTPADTIAIGANTLTFNTAGGDITVNSQIQGTGGSVVKEGAGTLLYYMLGNTYTGTTRVNDGTFLLDTVNNNENGVLGNLVIGDGIGAANSAIFRHGQAASPSGLANRLIADTATITVNADGLYNTRGFEEKVAALVLHGGSIVAKNEADNSFGGAGNANRLDVTGSITSTSTTQQASITGRLGLAGSMATNTINVATGSELAIAAIISDDGVGTAGGYTKIGTGTLYVSGDNTYTGTTTLNQGVVNVSHARGLGDPGYGTIVSATGAQLQLQGNITVAAEALTISGSGIAQDGALRNVSGNNTWGGNITVAATSQIHSDAGSLLTITGNISSGGQALTVSGAGDTTVHGTIGLSTLTKEGTGTLTVSNTNTYSTANVDGGTLKLAASHILADAMNVNLGAGGTLDVNTRTETIQHLNGSGTLRVDTGGSLVTTAVGSNGAFTGTLEVDGTLQLSSGKIGPADGTGSTGLMELVGSGTLEIAGDLTFNGTLELSTGNLLLSGVGTTFYLDTLHITGDSTIDFSAGIATFLHLNTLIIDEGASLVINGWTQYQDYFSAHNWGGAVYNRQGSDPMTRITFSGYSNNQTVWLNPSWKPYPTFGGEITVPEPRTYGLIFLTAALALLAWRRSRA